LVGLLYNANITKAQVTTGVGGYTWALKTADEILRDLNEVVGDMVELTNGVEVPDTILLPLSQYTLIATNPRSTLSDTTILEFFLKSNPSITKVDWLNELNGVNPNPRTLAAPAVDCMLCYKRSPDKLTLEIPQPFEQLPVEVRGLEYLTLCHERCGGVIVYYPLSVTIVDGI
jgi:hypothetical protein